MKALYYTFTLPDLSYAEVEGDGGEVTGDKGCQAGDGSTSLCISNCSVKSLDIFDAGPQHFNICKHDTTGYFQGGL